MMDKNTISVTSKEQNVIVNATKDLSLYYSNLAKEWAVKTTSMVLNEDYSAKYYANKTKAISDEAAVSINSIKNNAIDDINNLTENQINNIQTNTQSSINQMNILVEKTQNFADVAQQQVQETIKAKNSALSDIQLEAATQIENIKKTGFYIQDDKLYYVNSEEETVEYKPDLSELNLVDEDTLGEQIANVIPNNSELIASYVAPSDKVIPLTLGNSGTPYTAPSAGYYILTVSLSTNGYANIFKTMTDTTTQGTKTVNLLFLNAAPNANAYTGGSVYVDKGDVITIGYAGLNNTVFFGFVPAKGVE